MEYRDYYATLGVDKGASQADIKKAFRRLARENHPDVNKGDAAAEKRFKEISEANEVLSDPEKRKAYDQLGANWQAYQRAGATPAATPSPASRRRCRWLPRRRALRVPRQPRGPGRLQRLLPHVLRAARQARAAPVRRGGAGTSTSIRSSAASAATAVPATPPPASAPPPLAARAAGRRVRPTPRADATISLEEVTRGTERHLQVGGKTLEVKIPPGVRDGQRIRLSGKAEGGGNVYITVRVSRHPVFTRDGADLTMDLSLTLGEALLGAEVHISTLTGKKLALTIPAGTQNGRVFRLTGQGLPRFGAEGRGDLRVRTKVVLPTFLDDEGQAEGAGLHRPHRTDRPAARAARHRTR